MLILVIAPSRHILDGFARVGGGSVRLTWMNVACPCHGGICFAFILWQLQACRSCRLRSAKAGNCPQAAHMAKTATNSSVTSRARNPSANVGGYSNFGALGNLLLGYGQYLWGLFRFFPRMPWIRRLHSPFATRASCSSGAVQVNTRAEWLEIPDMNRKIAET